MSKSVKRSRQLSIFESFQNCKREKHDLMENSEKAAMRERLASAAEKRLQSSPLIVDVKDCQEPEPDCDSSNGTESLGNSEDLFPSPVDLATPPVCKKENEGTSTNTEKDAELNRWPACAATLPPLTASENHTILFRPHLREGSAPRPYPDEYRDRWDSDHVRMPCSPLNRYPVEFSDGERIIQNRWEIIRESLGRRISTSVDLENAIMQYNSQYSSRWNFRGLHTFLSKLLKAEQKTFFFDTILPGMIKLALQLPQICTQPIPLLKKHTERTLTLSQKQISCLLANAFFCTFPRRNSASKLQRAARQNTEYSTYPDINFNRLFCGRTKDDISPSSAEKLKCLFNYFLRVTTKEPTGTVTFHRKYQQVFPNWAASDITLKKAVVLSDGVIETEGHGMLQVDFANRYVGGGVLGLGCVQEEIRFIICPELIIARLFTEQLTDSEALVVTGVEQYNRYSGYGDSFVWDGDYQDDSARDAWGRKYTQVVAIDALHFRNSNDQFKLPLIQRELNKAYVGFCEFLPQQNLAAVATGNWGCGAFKGHPNLKFLVQVMAASQAGRGMLYFTFHDKKLQQTLQSMYEFIYGKKYTVGQIWTLLYDYCTEVMAFEEEYRPKLYSYIYSTHFNKSDRNHKRDDNVVSSSKPSQTNGSVDDNKTDDCDTEVTDEE